MILQQLKRLLKMEPICILKIKTDGHLWIWPNVEETTKLFKYWSRRYKGKKKRKWLQSIEMILKQFLNIFSYQFYELIV